MDCDNQEIVIATTMRKSNLPVNNPHQFRKGKIANPMGRPKGTPNSITLIQAHFRAHPDQHRKFVRAVIELAQSGKSSRALDWIFFATGGRDKDLEVRARGLKTNGFSWEMFEVIQRTGAELLSDDNTNDVIELEEEV